MSKVLDRNRYYALVYGDPVAKFYQDGIFYKGTGEPVKGQAKPDTSKVKEKDKPVVVEQRKSAEAAKKADTSTLQGMHISKLKKLAVKVAEATETETPELKGKGLKARLIAYIAENTD